MFDDLFIVIQTTHVRLVFVYEVYSLLGGDRMMHVEALQWLNCIFACRLRANCHQLYELRNAN